MRPVVAGTACCVVSALGYTSANICMRRLVELDCDPVWAICNKEVVAVLLVGPYLLWRAIGRRGSLPPLRWVAFLAATGLVTQIFGNLSVQWAYGVVGLAVTIPAIFGVMLTAGAVLGMLLLGESVPRRSVFGIGLLIVAIVLLALGSGAANESVAEPGDEFSGPLWGMLGLAAACLAGGVYAMLTVVIRRTVTGSTPVSVVVLTITAMGVLVLGPLSLVRLGSQQILETPPEQFAWMAAAGLCNLIAFLAITKGLELTTVVHANVLNASQVAMAAVAGILLFSESPTFWLRLGVVLTIVGIFLSGRPRDDRREADQHA